MVIWMLVEKSGAILERCLAIELARLKRAPEDFTPSNIILHLFLHGLIIATVLLLEANDTNCLQLLGLLSGNVQIPWTMQRHTWRFGMRVLQLSTRRTYKHLEDLQTNAPGLTEPRYRRRWRA